MVWACRFTAAVAGEAPVLGDIQAPAEAAVVALRCREEMVETSAAGEAVVKAFSTHLDPEVLEEEAAAVAAVLMAPILATMRPAPPAGLDLLTSSSGLRDEMGARSG